MKRKQTKKKLRARQAHQQQAKQRSVFTREASIDRASVDAEARTAAVSFSSQAPVQDRLFGPPSALLHERGAVNLAVIRQVGAALVNHDPSIDSIVGRLDSITIDTDDRVGRAVIHFDDDEVGNRAFGKVQSGSLRGVSVRFSVEKAQVLREKDEWQSPEGQKFTGGNRGLEVVTRWTPREISLTPIPADTTVGVGREQERENPPMSEKTLERLKARGLDADAFSSEDAAIALLDKLDADDAAREKREKEDKARQDPPPAPAPAPAPHDPPPNPSAISEKTMRTFADLARRAGDVSLVGKWLDAKATEEDAYREVVALLEKRNPTPAGPPLERGHDVMDKVVVQIDAGFSRRAGTELTDVPKDMEKDLPEYLSIPAAARMFCRAANVRNVDFLTDEQAIAYAMTHRAVTPRYEDFRMRAAIAHTGGDFPLILANVANKAMLMGIAEAQTTYQIVRTPKQLRDFRTHTFVQAGEIENLVLTPDTAQFPAATLAEKSQGMSIFTYSRKIGFGRQALINDDIGALSDMSRRLGNASARTRNKTFWDHILQASGVGPTMTEDSKALFATDHPSGSNYFVDAAANLQQSSLNKGRELLRKQKALTASKLAGRVDPSTPGFLNVTPTFIVVPAALEGTMDTLINGNYIPTTAATAIISFVRSLTPVVEPQLDATSLKAWYLFASPGQVDTIAFATLAGSAGPMFRSWQVDDGLTMWWAVVDDFGVQALEHRGVFRSKGEA